MMNKTISPAIIALSLLTSGGILAQAQGQTDNVTVYVLGSGKTHQIDLKAIEGQTPVSNFIIKPESVVGSATVAYAQTDNTTGLINWIDPKTGLTYEVLADGEYCIDMNNDSICDVTFINGTMILDERPQPTVNFTKPTPTPEVTNDPLEGWIIPQNTTVTNTDNQISQSFPGPRPETDDGSARDEDAVGERPNDGDGKDSGNGNNDDAGKSYGGHHCDENGVCIDPSVPKCGEGVEEVCYTEDGDLRNFPDYPECNYDEYGPTNKPCITDDGELSYDVNDDGEIEGRDNRDEDEEDTGGSNPDGEEDDQSCGGESCSDDEKEDSTTDEDSLYG